MPDGSPADITADLSFVFTKLLVSDLEKAAAFYTSVCGVVELDRVEAEIAGRPISEIVYQPTSAGGPLLILAKFHDATTPHNDETILGFATQDLETCLERVEKAGGRVVEPIQEDPQTHMRRAFIEDIEGHLVQLCQMPG